MENKDDDDDDDDDDDVLEWSVFEVQNFKTLAWYTENRYYVHSVLLM
jgi:hypothetical protein